MEYVLQNFQQYFFMIHSLQKYCILIAYIQFNAFHMLTEIICTLWFLRDDQSSQPSFWHWQLDSSAY